MEVVFGDKRLSTIFETERDKKNKIPANIIARFIDRIYQLKDIKKIADLWNFKSLRFERLKGYQNRYSIRVNLNWRIEFEIEWIDEEQTQGIITILKLSDHYGD